jgi:hypothetical protein
MIEQENIDIENNPFSDDVSAFSLPPPHTPISVS